MRSTKIFTIAIIAFSALLASCKKEVPVKSTSELLEAGTWNSTSLKENGTEMLNTAPQWTNVKWTFGSAGQGSINCDAANMAVNYSLTGMNITLNPIDTATFGNAAFVYTISSIDETDMAIGFSSGGSSYSGTFVH